VSLQKPKAVHAAIKRHNTATGREVQVPRGGIHEWREAKQGDWYTKWLNKRSSAWALSLCGGKTGDFKFGNAFSF